MKYRIFRLVSILFLALAVASIASGPQRARAAGPWYVTPTGNDNNNCLGPGTACSTISGVTNKPAFVSGDTIFLAEGTYLGSPSQPLIITIDMNLIGGWDSTFTSQSGFSTIDGQNLQKIVNVGSAVTSSFDRLILQNATSPNNFHQGAAVFNSGTLTISNSIIQNSAANYGGGIYNEGNLILNNAVIRNNASTAQAGEGGGIYNVGSLILNNSTVSGNISLPGFSSFGIGNSNGTVTLNSSTVSGNTGGILNWNGSVTLNNSTVSNNTVTNGGGGGFVNVTGTITLNNSTVAGNSNTSNTGGIFNNGGTVTLQNSILANNTSTVAGPDCSGTITSSGYNLIGTTSDCTFTPTTGDKVGTAANPINPRLSSLQNNGGPTFTHALLAGSPAINAGNPATPGTGGNACPTTDQRGVARPLSTACDIGAYEGYLPISSPLSPTGTISDITPTYKWIKVPGATTYQYQLWMGPTLVYTKTVPSSVCGATTCSNTPTTVLTNGIYKWKVRAMTGGVWKSYSVFKSFTLRAPDAGFWRGSGLEFYVTPDQAKVDNFAIYIYVDGCGNYKITHSPFASIVKNHFSFTGSFYASGTFSSTTRASGQSGLNHYYIAGCGYISGGPFSWSAIWKNNTQPTLMSTDESMEIFVEPVIHAPSNFYTIESVNP